MKKWVAGCLVSVMLVTNFSFAESVDLSFMDLALNKINNLSDTRKNTAKSILDFAMSTDEGLDTLKSNYSSRLTTAEKKELTDNGITDAFIQTEIDKLKTWSIEDRKALLEAGFLGDVEQAKNVIVQLNDKNDGLTQIEDGLNPQGAIALKEIAKSKGLLYTQLQSKESGKAATYGDIKGHWSEEVMSFLIEAKILSGKDAGRAAPDDTITNAEIIALTMRMFAPELTERSTVDANSPWYMKEKIAAEQLALILEEFDATEQPNRARIVDLLVKIYSAYGLAVPESDVNLMSYGDFAAIPYEYQESLKSGITLGLIQGMGDGNLGAEKSITRGQLAMMLMNLYNIIDTSVLSVEAETLSQPVETEDSTSE